MACNSLYAIFLLTLRREIPMYNTTNLLTINDTTLLNVRVNELAKQFTAKNVNTRLLDDMEGNRKSWEIGVYRASNKALYELLASCYAYCGSLTFAESKQRNTALQEFYKARDYKYNSNLPLETRVVRAVFGCIDRRRISTFSMVLRQAAKEQVLATDLATWIEQRGGVQAISVERSTTYMSAVNKAEIARQYFQDKEPICYASSESLSMLADANFIGEHCVLLAKQQADGSFGVIEVLRQESVLNTVFTALYGVQRQIVVQAQAEKNAANDGLSKVAEFA